MLSAAEHSQVGNYPASIGTLRKVLTLDPGHPNPRIDLANGAGAVGHAGRAGRFHTERGGKPDRHARADRLHAQERVDLSQGDPVRPHRLAGYAARLCLPAE